MFYSIRNYCYCVKLNQRVKAAQAAIQSGYVSVTATDRDGDQSQKLIPKKKRANPPRSLIH